MYDWYLNDEAHKACLYEAYESFEAIVAHAQGPVFTDIAPKYAGQFSVSRVEVLATLPAGLRMGMCSARPPRGGDRQSPR